MKDNINVEDLHDRKVQRYNRLCTGDLVSRYKYSIPDNEAIVAGEDAAVAYDYNERVTYEEFDDLANKIANAVIDAGVEPGDKIFTYCNNTVEYLITQIALGKTEAVAVVGNPMFPNDVLDHIITESEPKTSLVEADAYVEDSELFEDNDLDVLTYIPVEKELDDAPDLESFVEDQPTTEPDADIQPNDIFEIMYTSGTTGPAKGVMVSHLFLNIAISKLVSHHLRAGPRHLDIVGGAFYPLAHIGQGHPYSNLLGRGKTVLLRTPTPERVASAITEEEITVVNVLSPYMADQLATLATEQPDTYDLSSVEVVQWGWGSLDPQIRQRFIDAAGKHVSFVGIDGQTECSPDTAFYVDENLEKFEENSPETNYFGPPGPFYSTVALDEDDNIMPRGEEGHFEKSMRSPASMAGYYKRPEKTAETVRNGWIHSSDAGYTDEDGDFIFTGRFRDIIKSGGENVSAARVESAVASHPAVEDAVVIGLPHDRWLEAVTAVVVLKSGEDVTPEQIIDYCKSETPLAPFETPKDVVFEKEFPRTVGDKVQKFELTDKYKNHYE